MRVPISYEYAKGWNAALKATAKDVRAAFKAGFMTNRAYYDDEEVKAWESYTSRTTSSAGPATSGSSPSTP